MGYKDCQAGVFISVSCAPLGVVEYRAEAGHLGAQATHGAHLAAQPRFDEEASYLRPDAEGTARFAPEHVHPARHAEGGSC